MSPTSLVPEELSIGFPRVSGDEPFEVTWDKDKAMFSPRERG